MTVEEAIGLLQTENPKAELYVVCLGKSHAPRWSVVAGAMIQFTSPDILRRVVGLEARDGCVLFVQEDEAQLALADR